jgi:hypothetical protein
LEEDCDAATFFAAYMRAYGVKPTVQEKNSPTRSSPIRNYEGFTP